MSNEITDNPDVAKLILRLSFGLLYFMYGFQQFRDAVFMNENASILLMLFSLIVHVIAPLCVVLGMLTRLFSFLIVIGCVLSLLKAGQLFNLGIGLQGVSATTMYFFAFLSLVFFGSGRYAIRPN